jgi:hypothetical protein
MSAFHQMGHNSESMVLEPTLAQFGGVILSPVNYAPEATVTQCARLRRSSNLAEIYFDPQLYVPLADRGKLQEWPHLPSDFDTHLSTSTDWWEDILDRMVAVAGTFSPTAMCSPVAYPRGFDDGHYTTSVQVGNLLSRRLPASMRPVLTALIGLNDLARTNRHLEVASILTRFSADEIFIVFADETSPRMERRDSGELESAVRLIRLLRNAGFTVTVGHTSSEMILWKYAGASNVATGKFFNLRRFTIARFDEEGPGGGRNIPYWFEPSLLAFLREADARRLRLRWQISDTHNSNPHSVNILTALDQPSQPPWLAESWRQFLYWFAHCEGRVDAEPSEVRGLLTTAESSWQRVTELRLRLEEPANDGSWIRPWMIALDELDNVPD